MSPTYSHLGTVSSVTVYSALIVAEHTQLWNQGFLSSEVWSQGGADNTVSPFPEHNYWSCGMGF